MKRTFTIGISSIITAVFLLILFTHFFSLNIVDGNSMNSTLKNKEVLILHKQNDKIKNGDVVFFYLTEDTIFVKRVIATENQHIVIKNNQVFIDGSLLEESYITDHITEGDIDLIVPDGELFVMGDNREDSTDSRYFGTIEQDSIIGNVLPFQLRNKRGEQ